MDLTLQETNLKIQNALDHLKKELAAIRAGRANPTLLEDIPVEAYGTKMKLVELGTINTPQPSLLLIQVWDASLIKDVEKAIMTANLGLNPAVDGQLIRVAIPPLSEERREEFVKIAHSKGEEAKIELRQIRGSQREVWEKLKELGEFGEDELDRRFKLLQDLVDKSSGLVDEFVKIKDEELRQI